MIDKWSRMFNGIHSYEDLDEFVTKLEIKDLSLKKLIESHSTYSKISFKIVNDFFAYRKYNHAIQISDVVKRDVGWYGLFLLICDDGFHEIKRLIDESPYIQNKNMLCDSVYTYILGTCTNISYRCVITEIEKLKSNNDLRGSTDIEKYQYFTEILCLDLTYVERFFKTYPVLFEILCKKVNNIVDYIKEMANCKSKCIVF